VIKVLPGFILLLATMSPSVLFANSEECVPTCRSGYLCSNGACISRCNPPCEPGLTCTPEGECRGKEAKKADEGSTPAGTKPGLRVGVMAGLVLAGEIYADPPDRTLDTTTGFIIRAIADNPITPDFSMGVYGNYISSTAEFGSLSSDFSVISLGLTLKSSFHLSPTTQLRLGIGIGYQMTNADDVGDFGEDIRGFDLAPITELAMKLDNGMTALLSIAGFSQPSGGNDEADVSWSPIIFVAGGLQF